MRKFREVLRLSALGLAQHQIARSCSIVQSTVHKYLKLAQAAQLSWPLPENLSDQKLDQLLFGARPDPPSRRMHPPPDFAAIHKELQSHKDLTLELLWQEYKKADASGYGYSRFCDLYREWSRAQNITLRQQHQPGEKMFVDYAGATIPIHDRDTGEIHPAAIFVAAMGCSSYTFAEATWSQELPCWIGSHIRALEYFGGLPMFLWGICLRIVVGLHCTWLINSATHIWGSRRFNTQDDSRNIWWVALITFGEGWHNNHHAHPTSARHGLAWYEFDMSWITLKVMKRLKLAKGIRVAKIESRIPEQQAA